jgi:hypothetical protein
MGMGNTLTIWLWVCVGMGMGWIFQTQGTPYPYLWVNGFYMGIHKGIYLTHSLPSHSKST